MRVADSPLAYPERYRGTRRVLLRRFPYVLWYRCYERSDLHHEWTALLADVRRAHHRKAGFMAAFEGLAAGHGPSDAPSFLDRARNRWALRAEP